MKLRMLTADDKVAEIKRLYYATTAKTIQAVLARAVYIDGLAQMRADWNRKRQGRNGNVKRKTENGKRQT